MMAKIGVVGCGAVGSYYGARLACAGHEVHFLLRSDYEAVKRHGVRVMSELGDFKAAPKAAAAPDEIGTCDLVLIALKTTANSALPSLVGPLLGAHTIVVTLQNGLGNEEALAQFVPQQNVFGGLCFVCLNRVAPGVIHHIAHGQVVIGSFTPRTDGKAEQMAEVFRRASIPCKASENLAVARWEKLVWNIPFNGLGVASAAGLELLRNPAAVAPSKLTARPCLTTDQVLAQGEDLVRGLMWEVIAAARAQGLALPDNLMERQINLTRSMGPYRPSTVLDYEQGKPLEIESMFVEPLRRARASGSPAPLLEKLCATLMKLGASREAAR